jgi:hypothetical protein
MNGGSTQTPLPLALVQTRPGRQSTLVLQPPSGPEGLKKQLSGTRTTPVVVPVVVVVVPVPELPPPVPLDVDPDPPVVLVVPPEVSKPCWLPLHAAAPAIVSAQNQPPPPGDLISPPSKCTLARPEQRNIDARK